jgi:hypothetical protein
VSPASPSGICAGILAVTASATPTTITDGPSNYASNANCVWVVTSTARITVQFSAFSTEQSYDFVKLYNAGSATGAVAASYSGNSIPQMFRSSGNTLTISFTSDASVEGAGFVATVFNR